MAAVDDFADYEALLRRAGVRRSPNGSLMFEPGALCRPAPRAASLTRACAAPETTSLVDETSLADGSITCVSAARLRPRNAPAGADALNALRIPRLRRDRSLESAAAAALEPDERSRRRAAYVPTDLDELNAVLCEGDLELIAGEVDFHANAVKKAVAVRNCKEVPRAPHVKLTRRGAGAPAGAQGEAR